MTSKERMLVAMRHGQPDMVPVAPDIANMIPCRLTGMPFWKLYYGQEYPLWRAYADTVRFFGFDGWHIYGRVNYYYDAEWSFCNDEVWTSEGRFVIRTTCNTPAGPLWKETTYFNDQPPVVTRRWIKNLKEDMPLLRYMTPDIVGYDPTPLTEQMAYCGDSAAVGACVPVPGFHDMAEWFDGGLEAAVYAQADFPDEFEELVSWLAEYYLKMAEMVIDARPDFFMIGASGLRSLQSLAHFRKYSLPVIRKMTQMSKEAGLPSLLQSCGCDTETLRVLAEETDIDVIKSWKTDPAQGCCLAEAQVDVGHRLALMGDIDPIDVMLLGDASAVADACTRAINSAGADGGFILSTSGECSRGTSIENIRAFVATAREYRQQ